MKKRVVSSLLSLCLIAALLAGFLPSSASAATVKTGDYVGYLVKCTAPASYNLPKAAIQISGGYSYVPNIYITTANEYNKWSTSNPGSAADGQVAYCFNKSGHDEPYNQTDGTWLVDTNINNNYGRCYYNKIANATGDEFKRLATGESNSYSADELRDRIISVVLNGYPMDYSGFNKDANGNQILTDDEFRVLTQWAVWYYTDNYNALSSNNIPSSAAAQTIFNQLISTVLSENVTDAGSASLDLYESTGAAYSADTRTYQNLLAVTKTSTVDLPSYQTLTLKKSVVNQDNSTTSDDFTFTIELNTSNFWYETSGGANISISNDGKTLTVDLANNDSISIHVAEKSYDYKITEASDNDYTASAKVNGNDVTLNSGSLSGTAKQDTTVVYTNTEKEADDSTGVGTLTIEKKVTANDAVPDTILNDTEFTFTVTLTRKDESGNTSAYTGATDDEINKDTTGNLVSSGVKYTKGTTTDTQTISEDNTYTFTLKNTESVTLYLPAGVNGVHYKVTEAAATNFTTSSRDSSGYISKDTPHTATFTNTYSNSRKVYVNKVWVDEGNHTSHRNALTFDLNKILDGNENTKTLDWAQTTTITTNWSGYYTRARYENKQLTTYSVEETSDHEGYDVTYQVDGDNITITNTYDESLLNTLSITKELAEGTTSDQAFSFTVTLDDPVYDGTLTFKDSDGKAINTEYTTTDIYGDEPVTQITGKQITFTLKAGETVTLPAIYSGTTYTVTENLDENSEFEVDTVSGTYTDSNGTTETLTATDHVFSGKIENTPNEPWNIALTYTNKAVETEEPEESKDPSEEPTETPKPSESPKPSETPKPSESPEPTPTVEPSPSVDVTPAAETTTTETTATETTVTESASTKKTETKTETSTKTDKTEQKASTLPQTGAKWGLVIVLTLAGLAVMTVGLILRRKHEEQ
jgi:TQXA domain-containing protein